MYDIKNGMYNKAEIYYSTAAMMVEHEIYDESLLIMSQIATECYLSNILENLKGCATTNIFGQGRVPHDCSKLYNTIYNKNESGKAISPHPAMRKFDFELKKKLLEAFNNYNAVRYPHDTNSQKGSRIVNEMSIKKDFELLEDIKSLTEFFRTKFLGLSQAVEYAEMMDDYDFTE